MEIKKNSELIVDIIRSGANGEGVAVVDGIVIFVPFALVGEKVKIHIINDKNSFLVGKLIEVIEKSANRVNPLCPYYYKCGGCDFQHLNYQSQLKEKKEIIKNDLQKYAKIFHQVEEVEPSDISFRYRNKFAFPVMEEKGELKIGMFYKNSHRVLDIEDCLLQSEKTKIILKLFKEYMIENKISSYNEQTKKGDIKHIVVREHNNEFILTVVVTNKKFNRFEPLKEKLKKHFKNFGIVKNVNNFNNNVIFGDFDENIYGINELEFNEFGVKYFVNNRSFLQVNDFIKNKIYQKIIDELKEETNIIDAYSGAGLLSSILSKNVNKVYGVEIIKEATKNANNLKNINNLYNLTNINGDCAKIIPDLANSLNGDFSVVVDPPRKGLDKLVIDAFLKTVPKKIVYLSCNPATLARDLNYLKEKYNIRFIKPYDMFPQTSHVETLVSLIKK